MYIMNCAMLLKKVRGQWVMIILLLYSSLPLLAQKVIFAPHWTPQSQFAGFYAAYHKGFYDQQGVDVAIAHYQDYESVVDKLIQGEIHFTTLNLSQALYFKLAGVDLVNVMQTSQENGMVMVSHTPLKDLSSLQNKVMAIREYINKKMIDLVLNKYSVRLRAIPVNSGVNLFLSEAVDLSVMYSYDEVLQLKECGYELKEDHTIRFSDWGYNMPEEGVYVLRSFYDANPALVHQFVEATKEGWLYAAHHIEEAIQFTMSYIEGKRAGANLYHQREMLKEVLRLQIDPVTNERDFKLTPLEFENAINFMAPGSLNYTDFVMDIEEKN